MLLLITSFSYSLDPFRIQFITGPFSDSTSSATSYNPNTYAVSETEAELYYAGLHSKPRLLYCMGEKWSLPRGPEVQSCLKGLCGVFNHPIIKVWNHDLGWEVVKIIDAHKVSC